MGAYEGLVKPSVLYGCEAWIMNVHEKIKVKAVEIFCLQNICGIKRIDRSRNVEIKNSAKKVAVGERLDQRVLRWFRHMETMYDSAFRGVKGRVTVKR